MTRLEDNKKILSLLNELIELVPDQRFGQILINYVRPETSTDIFYIESPVFIKEIEKSISELNERLQRIH